MDPNISNNTVGILASLGLTGILYASYKLLFNTPSTPHLLESYCPQTIKKNNISSNQSKISPEIAEAYCSQCMDEYHKLLAKNHDNLIIESAREELAAEVYEKNLKTPILSKIPNLIQKSLKTDDSSISKFFFSTQEIPTTLTKKQQLLSDLQNTINKVFLKTSLIKQLNQKAQETLENINKIKVVVPRSLEKSLSSLSTQFESSDSRRKTIEQAILDTINNANKNMHQYHEDIQKFTQSLQTNAQGLTNNAHIYQNTIIPALRTAQQPLEQTIREMRATGNEIRDIAHQGNQMVNRLNGISQQATVNRRDLNNLQIAFNEFLQNDPAPPYPGRNNNDPAPPYPGH